MGWITTRFMQNRSKWGKTVSEEKRRAPLQRIVRVLHHRESMFDADRVELECGHVVSAYGAVRARCLECAKEKAPPD